MDAVLRTARHNIIVDDRTVKSLLTNIVKGRSAVLRRRHFFLLVLIVRVDLLEKREYLERQFIGALSVRKAGDLGVQWRLFAI